MRVENWASNSPARINQHGACQDSTISAPVRLRGSQPRGVPCVLPIPAQGAQLSRGFDAITVTSCDRDAICIVREFHAAACPLCQRRTSRSLAHHRAEAVAAPSPHPTARASKRRAIQLSSGSPASPSDGSARRWRSAPLSGSCRPSTAWGSAWISCCDPLIGRNRLTEFASVVSASLNCQPYFVADGSNLRLLAPPSCLTFGNRQAF